jgi:hypothetical protein
MTPTPLDDAFRIDTAEQLRALYGEPDNLPIKKVLHRLDEHCRRFISASPFMVLATHDERGRSDASPRGDAPGFVAILDDHHLFLADKPGNDRVDSLMNILRSPGVGMLFLIPGVRETLRINGRAHITSCQERLAPYAENGKPAKTGLIIEVEEAFLHCARALLKAKLWNPDTWPKRGVIASPGRIWSDHIALTNSLEGPSE